MTWTAFYPDPTPLTGSCVVAIGNFDGVHDGHKSLLALALAEAKGRGIPLVVLTFEPHPRTVLRPEVPLKRLTTLERKVELLGLGGVDGVAVLPFTPEVAGWSAGAFMEDILVDWLRAEAVCVGENFRFGHKAGGDVATLRAETKFTTAVASLLVDADGVVSSSRLRGA